MSRKFVIAALSAAALSAAGCVSYQPEDSAVGDYLAGRLAAKANDVDTASVAFTAAQADAPGATALLRDAFFFSLVAGKIEQAMPLAEALAKREGHEEDGLLKIVLAARALKEGRYVEARAALGKEIDEGYLVPTVKIVRAWATAGADGLDAAARILNDPIADEFKGFYPLHEALLAEQGGRVADARAAYQISLMMMNGPYDGAVGRRAYGAFLERLGDEKAARDYYALLSDDPRFGRQIAQRGLARLDAGQPSAAYAAAPPTQGAAIAFYGLGAAILEQTANERAAAERAGFNVGKPNYNMSLAFFQLALYLDPELVEARRLAGSILNNYGEHDMAIAMLSRIAPSSPYYERAQIELSFAYQELDQPQEAIAVLRQASRRSGMGFDARVALAALLGSLDRQKEAVKELDGLIAAQPETPEEGAWRAYLTRAAALNDLGDWPRAEIDLKRAVELAPEEAIVLNYLGYSWIERGLHLEKALAMVEKAVSLAPESGAIIDSLGWAHYQLGNYEEAVGHLERAAGIEREDPTITDHLGDVYWRLGRKLEARYQWRRVLDLDPSDALKKSVEEKLVQGLPDPVE